MLQVVSGNEVERVNAQQRGAVGEMRESKWKDSLRTCAEHPGPIVALHAIVREKISCVADLDTIGVRCGLLGLGPFGSEALFNSGILQGTEGAFAIRPEILADIVSWLDVNEATIQLYIEEMRAHRLSASSWTRDDAMDGQKRISDIGSRLKF